MSSLPSERTLTYEDLVKLAELIKSGARFSEFSLKLGEIEIRLRRAGEVQGEAEPGPGKPA